MQDLITEIRFDRNSGKYFLTKIESEIKSNWSNKSQISKAKQSLKLFQSEKLKGFNYWAAFLGLAITHTTMIYSKKQVLHQMERKAIPHLGICFGVAIGSGLIVGQMFGSSFSNFLTYNRISKLAEDRLNGLR